MAVYSISDLEKLCGVKAHTIRIWEQRYGILSPKRTKTNIRYYEDQDLRKLLNIALLNKNGYKISRIALLKEEEIVEKVNSISEINFEHHTQLDAMTISMIEMDEVKFDRIVRTNISQLGFERTMVEVIYPFLDKLSVLWLTGSISPIQESFMSHLIRQKLIAAIDSIGLKKAVHQKTFMIYLPTGESQELSLLFLSYLLQSRGHQVIYLGQNVTLNDLNDAFKIRQPDYLYTMITESYTNQSVDTYVQELSSSFPETNILLSGYQIVAQDINRTKKVRPLASLDDTLAFLEMLNAEN